MNRRTTFSLDDQTVNRLKKMAAIWKVSQAEVVRRALERVEKDLDNQNEAILTQLQQYHSGGGLDSDAADRYLDEVAANRATWERS